MSINEQFNILDKHLTYYRNYSTSYDKKYKKFLNLLWWKRRYQSYIYLKEILKNAKIDHSISVDYIVTKIINKYF